MHHKVVEILPGGKAVVRTRGLRRVVVPETGEIVAELLTPEQATWSARGWNAGGEPFAKVVPYRVDDAPNPRRKKR